MSVPVRFDQLVPQRQATIRANIATLSSKGATDDEIDSYLRNDEKLASVGSHNALDVRPDVTSALPRNRANPTGDLEATAPAAAANVLSTAQAIPGMEAIEAGAGVAGSYLPGNKPLNYQQSLAALRSQTDAIPGPIKYGERMAASIPLMALKPFQGMSAAKAGASLGAADQALSADPISSMSDLGTRAERTAAGGVAGAVAGKALDLGQTGLKMLRAPNASQELLGRIAQRKAASNANFSGALAEGADKATPEEITQFLQERDIQPIVTRLQQTRQYGAMAPSDPRFLDRIYKEMSDVGLRAGKTVDAAGANVNSAGVTKGEIRLGKEQLLSGMEAPSSVSDAMNETGFMPSYRQAVVEDAQRRSEEQAFTRGKLASKLSAKLQTPSEKQDLTLTPQAMTRQYGPESGARDAERQAALQGVYSNAQGSLARTGGRTVKRLLLHQANPISGANDLKQALDPSATDAIHRLLGIANANVANP